ncbi:mechanosensitive ion channel protein MscS [Winogradskyella sp. J14-2]|uniref:mechanosensitive ion channel family protein n=1 Tax=Winogradskyella sp. J14-2 TaxID=1936080 RepID=UPI0009728E54|nr:mechanosensitive ion channel family protein [Winogradskyella sp. J14-2]APY07730.1 mechanosensitive ion channel protein MscS [Winogradskyella sp. J14-2]
MQIQDTLESSWDKLSEKLSSWVDTVVLNLPNLLIAIVVFIIFYWLSGQTDNFINRLLKKRIKQPSIRGLVAKILSVIILFLGLILGLSVMNLDDALNTILASAGVAGLAVSLALQGTLSNTLSGFYLALNDVIKVGNWVETNGFSGEVMEITLRNTKVKEADNNIVVIPNKQIVENPFKNYALTSRIRTTITCGVAYDSNLREVKKIAIDAIEATFPPNKDEEIEMYFNEFGDSSINFMLRFWVDATKNLTAIQVKSEAIMTLKEAFDKHGIDIPFPIRTLIQKQN